MSLSVTALEYNQWMWQLKTGVSGLPCGDGCMKIFTALSIDKKHSYCRRTE